MKTTPFNRRLAVSVVSVPAFALALMLGLMVPNPVSALQIGGHQQRGGHIRHVEHGCSCHIVPRLFRQHPCCPPGLHAPGLRAPGVIHEPGEIYRPEVVDPSVPSEPRPADPAPATPPIGDLAMLSPGVGAVGAGMGAGMGLVGDFFSGGTQMIAPEFGLTEFIPLSSAGADRRYKLTENTSPFPTDRIFVNYHYFKNAAVDANLRSVSVRRTTLGLEKTLLGGMMSVEGRLPFAYGLDSQQVIGSNDNTAVEFGNISLALKMLVLERPNFAVSTGLGMIFPTASDTVLIRPGSEGDFTVLTVKNEAYHLQPFLGVHLQPTERHWITFFTQVDFTARGNRVFFGDPSSPPVTFGESSPQADGRFQDQHLYFADLQFGWWLMRNPHRPLVTGVAPLIELHYSTTIRDTDIVFDDFTGTGIMNPHNRMDVLNITGALRFELCNRSYLTVSGVAPLRGDEERIFDSEIGVQFMRLY